MPRSKYEFLYTGALTASCALFLAQLGNLSGLFEIGLAYRGWLYASLGTNIGAILCLVGRKILITYEEDRRERSEQRSARENIRRGLTAREQAKKYPFRNRISVMFHRNRSLCSKLLGWGGVALVVFSVVFYLVFAISNLENPPSNELGGVASAEELVGLDYEKPRIHLSRSAA